MSDKSKPDEFIQVNLENTGQTVSLERVRKILQAYQSDVYDYNERLNKKRLGKLLTIVDGAISDETQRKAIKDMVHEAWYSAARDYDMGNFPQLRHATEAIGFELYDKTLNEPMPVNENQYNKYKEM